MQAAPWLGLQAQRLNKGRPFCRGERNLGGRFGACCSMTKVRDNPDKNRSELDLGGQVVFARYARHGSVLVIPYVEAPPALSRWRMWTR